jgi:hypothetical protein
LKLIVVGLDVEPTVVGTVVATDVDGVEVGAAAVTTPFVPVINTTPAPSPSVSRLVIVQEAIPLNLRFIFSSFS